MNVAECVRACEAALLASSVHFGHGTDNARDEAAWLVLHVAGEPCDGSFTNWERPLSAGEGARVDAILQRRIRERKPLAYLLGEAYFCGLRFRVSAAVLVPRSPIAELIPVGFSPWVPHGRPGRVLDLCTGSGCIAVAIAHHVPAARVEAADISRAALALAAQNVADHGLEARVELIESDLFEQLAGREYDLIVSNPPYVSAAEMARLPAEYRAEPAAGLTAGEDGLDLVLRILRESPRHLVAGGVLICEVGESAERLQSLLPEVPFTWLEFEHGGDGVFTIGRDELLRAQSALGRLPREC
jgi:ribosomal protein L3 glutamine methyltransferase